MKEMLCAKELCKVFHLPETSERYSLYRKSLKSFRTLHYLQEFVKNRICMQAGASASIHMRHLLETRV